MYLEINISNTPTQGQPAEDAHNTTLNISIPTKFMFSGFRRKAVAVKCKDKNTHTRNAVKIKQTVICKMYATDITGKRQGTNDSALNVLNAI